MICIQRQHAEYLLRHPWKGSGRSIQYEVSLFRTCNSRQESITIRQPLVPGDPS